MKSHRRLRTIMKARGKRLLTASFFLSALALPWQQALASSPSVYADFNGDGYSDLATGVPGENDAIGAVQILYGGATGISSANDQMVQPYALAMTGHSFGQALASGDFNKDGYTDLAIGMPSAQIAGVSAGAVVVLPGSLNGLSIAGKAIWSQDSSGIQSPPEDEELFGHALTTGDFNGDGTDDLAIGVPQQMVNGKANAGVVHALYGSPAAGGYPGGLVAANSQYWHQDQGLLDVAQGGDLFGWVLQAGDFNGDGYDDLAVSVPGETIDGQENAGAVNVIFGFATGLTDADDKVWHQNQPGVASSAVGGEGFGRALAVADFDQDGSDDLVVGVPSEAIAGNSGAGAVHILYGTATYSRTRYCPPNQLLCAVSAHQFWHENTPEVASDAEPWEMFGRALATTDFNNDGYPDLAIGAPGSIIDGINAGAVHILYGNPQGGGLSATVVPDRYWHQGFPQFGSEAKWDDDFGGALAVGDFDDDGFADLAIAAPWENPTAVGPYHHAKGSVTIVYGMIPQYLERTQVWHQDSPSIQGTAENGDFFGRYLGN